MVKKNHELLIISKEGVVIRVAADEVATTGRSTQGVKIMNLKGDDRVIAIAKVVAGSESA